MVPRHFLAQKGFTVIEVLIAGAIIAVLSTLILANVGARRTDLTRAAQKLALDIRRAQNLSLAPSDAPNCIYGIRMASLSSYELYRRAMCGSGAAGHQYDASSQIIETISVEGAYFLSPGAWDIAAEPPEPVTYLNGATGTSPLLLRLQAPGGGQTKDVTVNRFGRVEIQ